MMLFNILGEFDITLKYTKTVKLSIFSKCNEEKMYRD